MTKWCLIITLMGFYSGALGGTGSISGRVMDKATQKPLILVNVVVMDTKLGAATDMNGNFLIENIEPGSYNVKILMMGYRALIKNRVVVKPGKSTHLEVGLEEEPIQVEGIVVRPTYFEKTKDAPVSSMSMDFEEIITQPGGGYDVQRAVQALPAVLSATDQNNEIIVRGGNYGENLFVIDNIEIPNPNHFAWQGTGGGPINMVNTDFIRKIDFMAGAFPAKYGGKASSVLDIRLIEGAKDGPHAKFDIGMAGVGGSVEGPVGDGSYIFSAHKSYLSLIKSSLGLTAVPHYYNAQGKLAYSLSPQNKLTLLAIYGNDRIRIQEEISPYGGQSDIIIEAKSHQYAFGGSWQSLFANGYSLLTLSRTLNYWNHYVTDTSETELYHNYATEAENTAKIDLFLTSPARNRFSLGVYLKRPEFNYDTWARPDTLFIYDPETGTIVDTTDYIYTLDLERSEASWKYGGYVQYALDLGKLSTLTSGLRYDVFGYTAHGYLSPRIGNSIHLGEVTDLNLAYGRHYQPPEWYQLTYDTANHYLYHKYTDQIVVGLDHLFAEDMKGTVEGYYKRYQDVPTQKAYTTPDPNDWDNVYLNEGEGYAKGLEFFLQKKVKQNLWGTLSYSYSIARAKDLRYPNTEYSWDFDYGHVLTSILGYRKEYKGLDWYEKMKKKWWYHLLAFIPVVPSDESEYSVRWRYLGGRPYTPMTWHPEWKEWTLDELQLRNSERMSPYKRFDLHLQQRWFFGKLSLLTYLEIENLFNAPNIWDYQYTDDGEEHTIYQYGRMVVGGLVLEF